MIKFNELRISLDNSKLYIEAEVLSDNYYKNVGITSIQIDTQDTFAANTNMPSSNVKYYKEISNENGKPVKFINICLNDYDLPDISLKDDILYIWVTTDENIIGEPPCGMDIPRKLGVCINWQYIYNLGIPYIKETSKCCDIADGFVDYILRYKAVLLAIKTGHYTMANKYWNKFFKNKTNNYNIKNCGCNGRI
jgi:hypothetical protein